MYSTTETCFACSSLLRKEKQKGRIQMARSSSLDMKEEKLQKAAEKTIELGTFGDVILDSNLIDEKVHSQESRSRGRRQDANIRCLIFVDCEGHGPAPRLNDPDKFEFGAVEYKSRATFHGKGATERTFLNFREWLDKFDGRK